MTLDRATERRLKHLAAKHVSSKAERDAAIREAFGEGAGLREIARATGLTHAGVKWIVEHEGET